MSDEIVIKYKPKVWPRGSWPCPHCGGLGHFLDGSISMGPDEMRIKPSTTCFTCNGKGRVLVSPIPDDEEKK